MSSSRHQRICDLNHIFVIIFIVQINLSLISSVNGDRGSFIGCYRQNLYLRRLDIFSGSVDVCLEGCEHLYFRYAVLDGNACLCTNTIKDDEVSNDECDRPCSENHDQFCGGSYSQSYYDTDVKVAGPPRNLRVLSKTDSTIFLQWFEPEQQQPDSLTRYKIQANIIKKFGTQTLSQLPQWMVEKTKANAQIELVNLNPGATYNLTVISYSDDYGEGGMASIIGETDIGIPDPEPPEPATVARNGKTLTIEIPPLINNNGPVSAIHVVVIFVDSELSQKFDESLLKNYKQAAEDGTNYYITAELSNEITSRKFVIGNGLNYGGFDNVPLPADRHVHAALGIISKVGNMTQKRYAVMTSHEQHGDKAVPLMSYNNNNDDGDTLTAVLIVACVFFAILLVLSVVGYLYLRLRLGPRLQRLPSDHHELTLQGPIVEVENNGGYQPDEFTKKNFDQKLNEILDQIDSDKRHARNAMSLDVNNIIANGQYGDVISGKLNNKPSQVHVVSDDMEPLDQSQFLKDFSTIRQFGHHKNVIEFYGVCQTANWLYLLFEDTPMTLKTMLIESRTPPTANPYSFSSLSEAFVLQTLYELSTALEFLSTYRFVHRKLCAYNVRMTSDETAKISCIGATPFDSHGKQIDLSRWMAPEVLRFQHYSERSDVWSFGCLIWECCSLGGTLYPSISSNDLSARIKAGARPDRIPFVFDDINQLMVNCWQLEPSERPTISEISFTLRQLLTSPEHTLTFKRHEGHLLPYYLPLLEVQNS